MDLGFQSKDLLFLGRRGIPCLGLEHGFELVVGLQHEGVSVNVHPFLIFVLLLADVGDKFTVGHHLVCLEEVRQEVLSSFPLAVKELIKSLT